MTKPLWRPSEEQVSQANLTGFLQSVRKKHPSLVDYESLYAWSVEHPDQFWPSVWSFCGIISSQPWEAVVSDFEKMPGARWFPGSRLNFAENLLRFRDDREAIVAWNESGQQQSLSYAELYRQVAHVARKLRDWGVAAGDRVAGFLPNIPESIVAMLATSSIGAIWSSTSPDFGLQGAIDRFGQIEPKVLFAADGYCYNGKSYDSLSRVAELVQRIPSIGKIVVTDYLDSRDTAAQLEGAVRFEDLLFGDECDLEFRQLDFNHPLYILYSSGTTGVPKCIVHGAGGTLIQHLKELVLHTDLKRDDRIFYFTTCGWMMWNWLVSSLAVGATVLLYDGSPFSPRKSQLFDMAEQERVTVFGASPKYLTASEKSGLQPAQTHDLSALRCVLSTGAPLLDESYDYVYQRVKSDIRLSSISGGTDIVSCFALGNPLSPVYRGELQTRGLGMKVLVYDDDGAATKEKGELVCAAPFPSMPIRFWNDAGDNSYRAAYFDHFPNVWRHGDFVQLTEHDGMVFFGRSDAVLNPGGVRIGTAEIYRQVEQLDEVLESVVVGQQQGGDVRAVLFVKLRHETSLDDDLITRIKQRIRENTTPRHVPAIVIQVADIPHTLSGKIAELAVREVIHRRPVRNRTALANPNALELFANLPELEMES